MTTYQAKAVLISYARDEGVHRSSHVKTAIKALFPEAGVVVVKEDKEALKIKIVNFIKDHGPVSTVDVFSEFKISFADMIKHIKQGYGLITLDSDDMFHYHCQNYGEHAREFKLPKGHKRLDDR